MKHRRIAKRLRCLTCDSWATNSGPTLALSHRRRAQAPRDPRVAVRTGEAGTHFSGQGFLKVYRISSRRRRAAPLPPAFLTRAGSNLRAAIAMEQHMSRKLMSAFGAFLGAGALLLASSGAQAAMAPLLDAKVSTSPDVHLAWCAAGLHVGPLGACLAGGPGPYYGPHYGPGWHRCWINQWGSRVCRW
jgi:hypothetical protein